MMSEQENLPLPKTAVGGAGGFLGRRLMAAHRAVHPDCVGTFHTQGQPVVDLFKPDIAPLNLQGTGHQEVIAVGGNYGTLSEIAFALGYEIPVVGFKTWQLIHRSGQLDNKIHYAPTPKEAVAIAMKLAREARPSEEFREFRT